MSIFSNCYHKRHKIKKAIRFLTYGFKSPWGGVILYDIGYAPLFVLVKNLMLQ